MKIPDFESEYKALFNAIHKIVPPSMKIYLVGGAVRDILLGRKLRDFDFTVEGLVRPIGKHIANELNGAYYVLDDEREMVRVIIEDERIGQFDIDIALLGGENIEEDLLERDFTLNAMAIELGDKPVFVDPLHGYDDLNGKCLRMCSPDSLISDPMRALRAVRMKLEFGLEMDQDLVAAMKKVHSHLAASSMERYRDELFKIIRLFQNGQAIDMCHRFGFLDYLFPDIQNLGVSLDAQFISNTDHVFNLLLETPDDQKEPDDFGLFASSRLGNYKEALIEFFNKSIALYHNRKMLTAFSSIVSTFSDDNETIRAWCSRLALSGSETSFVCNSHLSYHFLKEIKNLHSFGDVDIYRYFRQYKEGGLAGLILFLADGYLQQNIPNGYKIWCDKVVLVQDLISAFFTRYMEVISPRPYLSGDDIQRLLEVESGPIIGYIKTALTEAQIRGTVKNITEAESFVKQQAKHFA